MWSGGGEVSTFFWEPEQPNNRLFEDYGLVKKCGLHDATSGYIFPFLCYRVVVVRERKTWEEALDYCREHHHNLASVASDTEMLLIQKELGKNINTEPVWIGLHFFPAHWLWVDRRPLVYEAWAQQSKPDCPEVKLQCAWLLTSAGSSEIMYT
uniref:C-type lectin domain-containing protein n=1 Tax=Lates calcarifer TaxID=8187 RepID=A0A4W6F5P9_LATCA